MILLSVDPGRDKCGLALLDGPRVLLLKIIETSRVSEQISEISKRFKIDDFIIGDGTAVGLVEKQISEATGLVPFRIDETGSTLEARKLYFFLNPPTGWSRLIPKGLLSPPVPIDDYAALILALARTGLKAEQLVFSGS